MSSDEDDEYICYYYCAEPFIQHFINNKNYPKRDDFFINKMSKYHHNLQRFENFGCGSMIYTDCTIGYDDNDMVHYIGDKEEEMKNFLIKRVSVNDDEMKKIKFYSNIEDLPSNIKMIKFGHDKVCDIDGTLPNELEFLVLAGCYDDKIDNLPSSLIGLEVGVLFNETVDFLPINLKFLSLADSVFNNSVDNLPPNLEYLFFGNHFNQPVDNLPNKLKIVHFGYDFNQPIDNLPDSIEELALVKTIFGEFDSDGDTDYHHSSFNQKINKLPKSLKRLYISERHKEEINNIPEGCEIIKIGYYISEDYEFGYDDDELDEE